MTDLSLEETESLLRSLRQKQGNWVQWGQACQKLQKLGYSPQAIFEETGFEPIQQNQIIVGAQVYQGLDSHQAPEAVLNHFGQRGSDSLYELRILSQGERVAAATFLVDRGLDSEFAHELAKAIKDFSRLSKIPEGFTNHPGDVIAYQCWKNARQQSDLQQRSLLIAKGLRFASSESARHQVEKLLTDFSLVKAATAPRLPLYRPDDDTESPRIIPVAGKMPITKADLGSVPITDEIGKFRLVKFAGAGMYVALPSWQVILEAEDAIAIIADLKDLDTNANQEEILVIVDRAQRQWQPDSYFLVDQESELTLEWFAEAPPLRLLGRLILVLRPKKVLDEDFRKDLWQLEE